MRGRFIWLIYRKRGGFRRGFKGMRWVLWSDWCREFWGGIVFWGLWLGNFLLIFSLFSLVFSKRIGSRFERYSCVNSIPNGRPLGRMFWDWVDCTTLWARAGTRDTGPGGSTCGYRSGWALGWMIPCVCLAPWRSSWGHFMINVCIVWLLGFCEGIEH